jgi:hypothetical protein
MWPMTDKGEDSIQSHTHHAPSTHTAMRTYKLMQRDPQSERARVRREVTVPMDGTSKAAMFSEHAGPALAAVVVVP